MYRILDTDGVNLVGEFATEREALLYIRDAIALNGVNSIGGLSLAKVGAGKPLARGEHLAQLALGTDTQKRSA